MKKRPRLPYDLQPLPSLAELSQLREHIEAEVAGLKEFERRLESVEAGEVAAGPPETDCNTAVEDAGLEARHSRARKKARRQRTAGRAAFDLGGVKRRLDGFVHEPGGDNAVELPPYSRMQRQQVKKLAELYGLEARNCGRQGQTFFLTGRTAPLSKEADAQAQRLLACSISFGRPTEPLRAALRQPSCASRSAAAVPIAATNRGHRLLKLIGWRENTGLGRDAQGPVEPIAVVKRKVRQGLGHESGVQ